MRKLDTPEDRSDTPAKFRWGPGNAAPDEVQEKKRGAILAAAAELFNRNGYMRTSLTDVAQSLALTKAALYYYFKDKQSLLFACSLVAHQGAQRVVEEALRDDTGADGLERLSLCLQRYALHVMDGNFQSVMFLDSREFSDEQVTEIVGCRDAFDRGLRELIRRGVDDGSIRPCDPKLASLALLGAVNWIARWYRPGGALSIEAAAEQVVTYALTGIAAPAGVSSPAGRRAPAP